MTEAWQPEYVITADQAKIVLESQFPEVTPATVREFGSGFDNTVYLVNNKYVLRFPRRSIAVKLIEKEYAFLTKLSKVTFPVSVPKPQFFGQPQGEYPWPFMGYEVVEGNEIIFLNPKSSHDSIKGLAGFLKKLHQIPAEELNVRLPLDEFGRSDMMKRKPILDEMAKRVIDRKLFSESEKLCHYVQQVKAVPASEEKIVVHGDMHIRNLLVDEEGKVCGVIDWGDVHLGDPAVDLSIAYSFFPPESRHLFFQEYGEVDSRTQTLARFIAIYILVILVLYGADHDNTILIKVCCQGLDWALTE